MNGVGDSFPLLLLFQQDAFVGQEMIADVLFSADIQETVNARGGNSEIVYGGHH